MECGVTFRALLVFLGVFVGRCQGYTATVVEYSPDIGDSPEDTILKNVERYRRLIESANSLGSTLVVFPEYGLTDIQSVQDNVDAYSTALPSVGSVPCDYDSTATNYSKPLIDLSCNSRTNKIYVVVNLIERALNSTNDTVYYNTNVVFNRNGAIEARYRKINLNNERALTPGDEVVTFSTDFATFGIFTSEDILFKKPARDILSSTNITNIIYPTRWTIENPFLPSLGVQAGYARSNGLNLLAAGLSNVPNGTTGSGFHFYNGTNYLYITSASAMNDMHSQVPETAVRVSSSCNSIAPRSLIGGGLPNITEQRFLVEDMRNYTFSSVNLSNNTGTTETVCSGSFCCNFAVSVSEAGDSEFYKFAAFYGVREWNQRTIGVRICALVACETDNSTTCGFSQSGSTRFDSISVSGNFVNNSDVFDQPITLLTNYQPLSSESYTYCADGVAENSTVTVTVKTLVGVQGIRSFGIFGRVYSNDGLEAGPRSGASALTAVNLISLVILSYVVFFRE